VGLDLQSASYRLIVVRGNGASFDVRFDFHTLSFSLWLLKLNIARRRHTLGFEAEGRRSPVHAQTRRLIAHAAEIFLRAKKPGVNPALCSWRLLQPVCRLGSGGTPALTLVLTFRHPAIV